MDETTVTELLETWSTGDSAAFEQLMPLVFDDIRQLARRVFARESPGHTLQPTALVAEVYLRLEQKRRVRWRNKEQFFGFLTTLMRRILVDHARRKQAMKRGSGLSRVPLESVYSEIEISPDRYLDLERALDTLAAIDLISARIIELRFFFGLKVTQLVQVLEVSERTIRRKKRFAYNFLRHELRETRATKGNDCSSTR